MVTKNNTNIDFAIDVEFDKILTNPILDIAARFWEKDRYEAFQVCYRSMRVIDDLVDSRKASGIPITEHEIEYIRKQILNWLESLRNNTPVDSFQKELLKTINAYKIPIWPWERLAKAMIYDLEHNGFKTFLIFLRYCEGAAIAPASIFMHLCGVKADKTNVFTDLRKAARPLAVFSYIVHIIRDFQKDRQAGLNYFADSILSSEGVAPQDLKDVAAGKSIKPEFRSLIGKYHQIGEYYRKMSRANLNNILPLLGPQYQLSLEVIYGLYLQIYERVKPQSGLFNTAELNPSPDEVKTCLNRIISKFKPL
ncbi:MAG: squalene/phytoene synthase family protein [bacterium]